jgi:hypothetical protein
MPYSVEWLSGTGVGSSSEVCMTAMLVLVTVRN